MASAAATLKLRLLDEYAKMYASRVQVALDEFAPRFQKVAVVATVGAQQQQIVPDMAVEYLERDALLGRLDTRHAGAAGALAMFDNAPKGAVPFGLIFAADGDALMMTVSVAPIDR